MIQLLEACGLSERESRIYLTALEIHKSTIDKIAKAAGLQRTTAYNHVESLMKKGLMSTVLENKRTYYIAESPEHILHYIEHQKADLELSQENITAQLPTLLTKYNQDGSKPAVRMFSGIEGVRAMREDILGMKDRELLIATDLDKFHTVFFSDFDISFTKKRQRKKIKNRVIYTSNKPAPQDELIADAHARIDKQQFPFDFTIYLYDHSVAITSLESDNLWGVVIDSKAVSSSIRTLYELAWNFANK